VNRALLVAGVLVVLGGSVAAAMVVGDRSDAPTTPVPTTSAPATTSVPAASSTSPKVTTTVLRPATTRPAPRTTAPNPTTTLSPTTTTVAPTTTTTRPVLTGPEASRALCSELGAAIQIVSDGNTVAGGLRLLRAVNTYGDVADPTVVAPARRILSAGLAGDLETAGVAAREAASSCARLGYPIGTVQCITAPCP